VRVNPFAARGRPELNANIVGTIEVVAEFR
jgi:hypothetical protein